MTAIRTTNMPDGSAMPVFGLGTWHMGGNASAFADEVAALRAGLDLGVTLIDTAEMYASGGAERVVAEAIKGRRDETFLVSKVLPTNAAYDKTIAACEASLERLGTDHLDLYLYHWPSGTPFEDTIRAFEDLQQDGKILRWGVSNFDVDEMEAVEEISDACQANQVLYNLMRRGIEHDLVDWCEARSMPIMAYSPLEQGSLLNDTIVREIAEARNATPAQIALAWILRNPSAVVIPKSSKPERIRENLGALDIALSDEELEALDDAFPPPSDKQSLEMI
ncbi:hypothetical protein GCM10007989_36840 [Devosia pacifica]|uniref:NADP-dependent oxidoreductase domain-containing protein n=1 Tax=Devosia pacifica TaxID=1335967 RepID=A0A918SG87_9HYPH|nr:aldo/keto reductase [Devosia pacifica]GHA37666.1 hypothetical protein GCM10007989_36840 [Devosia pacifica]